MKKNLLFVLLFAAFAFASCSHKREGKPLVLVFSKTAGFVHSSIPNGIAAIQKLGQENGFDVDTSKNADVFNDSTLKKYSAIVFLSTTGDVLNYRQEAAFERYIQSGGGFVGIHAATDTEYDWGWYGRLVGAYFNGHPKPQPAKFIIKDKTAEATKFFTDTIWQHTDELYNYKKINPDLKILVTIDEGSYEGGTNGAFHPMSWYHDFDGGRAFYTEMGHTEESWTEPNYLKHLLGGIHYAIADNNELNYSKAHTELPPDEDRFVKSQLAVGDFYEPTEMTVLPNLDILVVQRRGEVMLYKNETKKVKQVGFFNVYYKTLHTPGVNAEEGMLGLSKDPDYEKNHWVYIYYSPADSSVNRLSRFTFENDTLKNATEKVILEVKSQREICCHTGGSIAFGPDKLLYLSAGDNSTPFDEKDAPYVNHGYAPLNDIPGHQQYDARRSAGNTNDLRGKIMRIRVKDDGSYEIPEGNLFPKGQPKTRPEIYVMGDRNPYRISVDQKNSNLYWGEVGPDARADSMDTRGPKGYDELNQARHAGFFGWPLFVGNNRPYRQYNYETGQSGEPYNPEHPVNNSRNNTGLTELPPVSPAFIYYPYDASPDFPQVGTGGRNAMAGPVYYTDMYPKETRLPDYYNGKLIFYEWIRGWMKAVTMLPNGDFDKMEPFAPGVKTNSMIDMEVGPDGRLYMLEYGTGWFHKNPDAGLARLDYISGNRPPAVSAVQVNRTSGVLPFAIKASVEAKDPEHDNVKYIWDLGNGVKKETTAPELDYTYTTVGDYKITVEAKDDKGAAATSAAVNVYAGNEMPQVNVSLTGGNKSFYLPGKPLRYAVTVQDPSDTAKIDPANLFVSTEYVEGYDRAASTMGHQQGVATISGKNLIQTLDCKGCHKENEKSIGPAYVQVGQKYQKDPNAMSYLTEKVIKGGSGVWGENAMPAHPSIPQEDLQKIISWVLSLGNTSAQKKSMAPSGTYVPVANEKPTSTLVLTASYTDKGGNNSKALTGTNAVSMHSNSFAVSGRDKVKDLKGFRYNGNNLAVPREAGWFASDSLDFTDVNSVLITSGWPRAPKTGFDFEARLDAPDGKLLGKGSMPVPGKDTKSGTARIPLQPIADGRFHKIYFQYKPQQTDSTLQANISMIGFNAK
ncbi:MAG: ThuA domain-containing protein [Williamsia sp.]|nr:ThuA domain-containing protein [Williamsia sp.]